MMPVFFESRSFTSRKFRKKAKRVHSYGNNLFSQVHITLIIYPDWSDMVKPFWSTVKTGHSYEGLCVKTDDLLRDHLMMWGMRDGEMLTNQKIFSSFNHFILLGSIVFVSFVTCRNLGPILESRPMASATSRN